MATDAEALLAEGQPITLGDGITRRLRYPFRALVEFERRFGSVPQALTSIQKLQEGDAPLFSTVATFASVGLDMTEDDFIRLADAKATKDYLAAIIAALDEAFPTAAAGEAEAPGESVTNPSPGAASITPPPSHSNGHTVTSGA